MQKLLINAETGVVELVNLTESEEVLWANQVTEEVKPAVVTMRQARLALFQQNLLTQVQTVINSLPSPQREAAQIEWDYSSEVHKNKPFVQTLSAALGLTTEQLDNLFVLASTL